jgi:hypothetical protein
LTRKLCEDMFTKLDITDTLFDTAITLEKKVLEDEYFQSRKLYPTMDFYTGMLYRILGVPTNMYTVIFACARVSGWMAHWKEMCLDKERKIGRPRQLFVGQKEPKIIVDLADRKEEVESRIPESEVAGNKANKLKIYGMASKKLSPEEFEETTFLRSNSMMK